MAYRIPRSAPFGFAAMILFSLALLAASSGVSAQQAKAPLPPGVTACDFGALANDQTREGLNIRAEPRADSAILGRLPVLENRRHEKVAPDLHVIGVWKGWFFVEGAAYPDNDFPNPPPVYGGRGWVSGKLLTTGLQGTALKAAPDDNAADVPDPSVSEWVAAILDCKGVWLRVEEPMPKEDSSSKPKPPAGAVRGWSRRSCTNQRTTCDWGGAG